MLISGFLNLNREAMKSATGPDAGGLWAITCYFNPLGYRRRLTNFRVFRERLQVPLVAVELAYGPKFELQEDDAEVLIQLHGKSVLWQKERLLNLALQSLPGSCQKVAWLDCDIIFAKPQWIETADRLLDQCAIVQLFRQVYNLGPQWDPGKNWESHVEFPQGSAGFAIASGLDAADCIARYRGSWKAGFASGLAWAARREIFDRHSFFDAGILGGGDRAMACAAHRCFDEFMQMHCMHEQQRRRYISWAEPFYETVRAE